MSEERELLELAAKAAGIRCKRWVPPGGRTDGWHGMYTGSDDDGAYVRWNPLTDDGDALRLAVRLAMTVRQEPSASAAGWSANCLVGAPTKDGRGPWFWKEWIKDNQDPYAATRRAIVRAAAEIVRGMK